MESRAGLLSVCLWRPPGDEVSTGSRSDRVPTCFATRDREDIVRSLPHPVLDLPGEGAGTTVLTAPIDMPREFRYFASLNLKPCRHFHFGARPER